MEPDGVGWVLLFEGPPGELIDEDDPQQGSREDAVKANVP